LTAADAAAFNQFGNSISISGDTIVVGAVLGDGASFDSGSAYVFERNSGGSHNWGQVKKLAAADAATDDRFGIRASISGDTIAVGADLDDDAGSGSGSAYVFERDTGGANNWAQVTKLTAADAAGGDEFGFSLSISGDTVVIGAVLDDSAASDSGSAYVFEFACTGGPGEAGADLRASRTGSSIGVTFAPACSASDHAAYWGLGPIVGSLQWVGSACGLGPAGSASFDPGTLSPGQLLYFVVVGYDSDGEGSYGADSALAARPEAVGIGACDRLMGPPGCP
jgi:hypothetical protein